MKNLCGHRLRALPELYAEMQHYLESTEADIDRYGEGAFLNNFEAELAAKLGLEAAVFLPSGVMAQLVAIKLWALDSGLERFACHETCHLINHEEEAYRELLKFEVQLIGTADRMPLADDLDSLSADSVSSLIYELPLRSLGGELPTWDQWCAIKRLCRDRGIRLHIDGARVFETATHFGHSVAEIVAGADSVFLSFYKGFGSTSGSMLLGSADFIQQARTWIRRFGGNLYQIYALALPARLNYTRRLDRFPDYVAKAKQIAQLLQQHFGLTIIPATVQTNMFHVVLPLEPEILKARLQGYTAAKLNLPIWTDAPVAGMSRCEFTVGDATLEFSDEEIVTIFEDVLQVQTQS